ncbi:MAG: hypothetical protein ACF8XB_19300, partial [Planctomycetota bacterium JB042]
EKGTAEWFRSWDVHAPGKEALERRSAASPGRAAIVAHLASARSDWIPPLERLLRLNDNSWEGQPLSSTVSNDAWAEAVIDVLLTDRRAKRLREELLDELTKEGLSGTGILILPDGLARALEKAWSAHVDSFRAGTASDDG